MLDIARRLLGFAMAASLVAYLVFVGVGAALYAQAQEQTKTVWVRDQITPNTHRLAGIVTVPKDCLELTEKTEQLSDSLYRLKFTTWEQPDMNCADVATDKEFYEVVFAPAVGVTFIATLDGAPLPMTVVPYTP